MTTLKTVLNHAQPIAGFVYARIDFVAEGTGARMDVALRAHAQIRPKCSQCLRACPGYDHLPVRKWCQVPAWNIRCAYHYAPRRVSCPEHGVVVEHMPWSEGKRALTVGMMAFLSMWARRLSWKETARAFKVSWESVFRSVEWTVNWGLEHRVLEGVKAIGIDELYWSRRQKNGNGFLTVIYQIDEGMRRLLWVGLKRRETTLKAGLKELGPEVVAGLEYVCSDMWKPYLKVIRERIGQALHVLDRYHIASHLNLAVDQVRRGEVSRMKASGKAGAAQLKDMRLSLLRKGSRVRGKARQRLNVLVASKLATARAWMLKESFHHFWTYRSVRCAGEFLDAWCSRAMRSRLAPVQKVARRLQAHRPLIMNWFRAKGELSSSAVEGLNNKIRVNTRRAYGFRTFHALEVSLYHLLGKLPEPPPTHRFC
ncbi:MAG: ISL3 family transposase [bacterium]